MEQNKFLQFSNSMFKSKNINENLRNSQSFCVDNGKDRSSAREEMG